MSPDIKSIGLVFHALLDDAPWRKDHDVIEMPWRQTKYDAIKKRSGVPRQSSGRLVFGLLADDGNVHPSQNIAEGLGHLKQVLLDEGHEVLTLQTERMYFF